MVQQVEQPLPHKQLLERARQLFETILVRSQLLVEYYLVGIQRLMDLELVTQAVKRALAIMEI
jgi:hypothetical protein